jgi:hypothetical protein
MSTESQQASDVPALLLETNNPLDMEPAHLEELAARLRPLLSDIDVALAYEDQAGAGVTLHEVLHVWLPSADFVKDAVWTLVFNEIITFMKERFRRPHSGTRAKSITFNDPNGNAVLEITIKSPDGPITELPPRKRKRKKPRRR